MDNKWERITNTEHRVPILKRLFKDYTKKYLKKIIFAFILSIFVAGSTSSIAWLLDPAIKKLFIEKDTTLIFLIPLAIVIAFATKGLSQYLAKTTMITVGEHVKRDVQMDLLRSLVNADTEIIENKHTGKFLGHLSHDVSMITNLISVVVLNLFKDTVTLIGLLTVMFYQNWKLSLLAIVMIPLASVTAKSLGKRIEKVATQAMVAAGDWNSYLMELFKNHKLMKIFQNEKYEEKRAKNFVSNLMDKTRKIAIVFQRASPIMETLTGIMIAVLIFYSGKLIMNDELDINNFFSFLAAMMLAYQPVRSLATINMAIGQGVSASKRLLPIIDNTNKIIEKNNSKDLIISSGDIEFKDVNFRYKTTENITIKNLSLKISGGKMTSLVGHSGAGKSTILNFIPRFYDCDNGDILIDNKSIYDHSIFSLRKNISLVSQDVTLFDDSFKNNIAYAKQDATEEEIINAAKLAFAHEFIINQQTGYDTLIGENGVRLSGGEKQRISIARAILKQSPIILLDEATSSLDAETEDKIQKAVNILTKNRTTIVIAHRLSTILNSDKIIVIDKGALVDEGKHDELLIKSKIYENFYKKQIKN